MLIENGTINYMSFLSNKRGLEATVELIKNQVLDLQFYSSQNGGVLDREIEVIESTLELILEKGTENE